MLINELKMCNGYTEIKVKSNNNRNIYCHIVKVDTEDLAKIGKIRVSNTGYAYQAKKYGKSIASIILNVETNTKFYVDHINGNTLDNRKCNLRFITASLNARNRHKFNRNNTGVVGIAYRKNGSYEYYRVSLTNNEGKRITKQFNINKLGKNKAFRLAKEYLNEKKTEFNYVINS
jgi:hypothetical protein